MVLKIRPRISDWWPPLPGHTQLRPGEAPASPASIRVAVRRGRAAGGGGGRPPREAPEARSFGEKIRDVDWVSAKFANNLEESPKICKIVQESYLNFLSVLQKWCKSWNPNLNSKHKETDKATYKHNVQKCVQKRRNKMKEN